MPTTVLDRITDAQASVLGVVDQTREPAVGAVSKVVEVTGRLGPNVADRRRRVVPAIGNVIDSQFTFAIELLKRQRANTKAVVKAASAKAPSTKAPSTKTTAKTAADK
jgi:hypothetical protein